jgi:hypothetical protein
MRIDVGNEGRLLLNGREQGIFPWPLPVRIASLLWVGVAIIGAALGVTIAVLAGRLG